MIFHPIPLAEVQSINGSVGAHGGPASFHQTILFSVCLTSQFDVPACRGLANAVNAAGNPVNPAGPDDPRCQVVAPE
jgi:hypothetical protein